MGANYFLHCFLGTGPSLGLRSPGLRSALLHNLRHVKAHKLRPFVHTHTHTHTHTYLCGFTEKQKQSRTQPYKQPRCGFITIRTDTHTQMLVFTSSHMGKQAHCWPHSDMYRLTHCGHTLGDSTKPVLICLAPKHPVPEILWPPRPPWRTAHLASSWVGWAHRLW